jgi:hypothetical protein
LTRSSGTGSVGGYKVTFGIEPPGLMERAIWDDEIVNCDALDRRRDRHTSLPSPLEKKARPRGPCQGRAFEQLGKPDIIARPDHDEPTRIANAVDDSNLRPIVSEFSPGRGPDRLRARSGPLAARDANA